MISKANKFRPYPSQLLEEKEVFFFLKKKKRQKKSKHDGQDARFKAYKNITHNKYINN
jgi:hypothetical protein